MKKTALLILLLCLYRTVFAQFEAVLTEGDYAPVPVRIAFEEKNRKYKDAPRTTFDSQRKLWHATWTQFDAYKSRKKSDLSVIYYSRSDEGRTWTPPRQLNTISGDCLDGDSTLKGPVPCVGPQGEVYVSWIGPQGLAFQCSRDSGKTWLKEEKIIHPVKGGWRSKVGAIQVSNLPFIACDLSGGEFRGRIYICWSDEKNGANNKDVFLVYSDDQGENWTDPVLVTYRPNHKDQFRPCLRVDTLKGDVYLLYFDRQNFQEGPETDLYLAISRNGGLKFDHYKVTPNSFAYNSNFLEIADHNGIRARWVQADGPKRFGLYEVLINDSTLQHYNRTMASREMKLERSFTYADKVKIAFTIPANAFVTAVLTKPLAPGYEKVLARNVRAYEGENSLELDMKAAGVRKGNYVLTLYYGGRNTFTWITEE
jgi:hypothetical protein